MSHRFYEGEIYHKRFFPKEHAFTYDYFFLDINADEISTLKNKLFGVNGLGIMSFYSQDHFGQSSDFLLNAQELIDALDWGEYSELRFLTLPRIFNFVFNPISVLLLLNERAIPTHCVAEVHNYNGGRVLYPMVLIQTNTHFSAECPKSMYVSPFMGYEGRYKFEIDYTPEHFGLRIDLISEEKRMLVAHFSGAAREYSAATIRSLLCGHTFLSLFVVTRTLYQSLRLKLKGLSFYPPRPQDQLKKDRV